MPRKVPLWYHPACMKQASDAGELGAPLSTLSLASIDGAMDLAEPDRAQLAEVLGLSSATARAGQQRGRPRRKRARSSAEPGADPAATGAADAGALVRSTPSAPTAADAPPPDPLALAQQQQQTLGMWAIKDQLTELGAPIVRELLSCNGLLVQDGRHSGAHDLREQCSDAMYFGCTQRCPICRNGILICDSHTYHCHGSLSEWARCDYVTRRPDRVPFNVPDQLRVVSPFLDAYHCVLRERVFPPTYPLRGHSVTLCGRLAEPKERVAERIRALGGTVADTITARTTLVISTESEVEKRSPRIAEALERKLPIVRLAFLDRTEAAGRLEPPGMYALHTATDSSTAGTATATAPSSSVAADAVTTAAGGKTKVIVKGRIPVDPASGLVDTCHVLQRGTDVYSATLGLVDINTGQNSYYKLQVLQEDRGRACRVFRAWGRVGTTIGGHKLVDFHSADRAVETFEAIYYEKTGNLWSDRRNFIKRPAMHYPLEIDFDEAAAQLAQASEAPAASAAATADAAGVVASGAALRKSALLQPVQELLQLIFDENLIRQQMRELELDLSKMPLGKLTRKHILNAYSVLQDLSRLLSGEDAKSRNAEVRARHHARVLEATTRFYTLIPHDFQLHKPPLINSERMIVEKTAMLDSLMDIEIAVNLLKDDMGADTDEDPIDAHYRKLMALIEPVATGSDEYAMIERYVRNTHAPSHDQYALEIEQVFRIQRHEEAERFKAFTALSNHMLLWHGSRLSNYAGILQQGLRIAPPEAPVTGYMFGKGIYFADMVSKSANYCYTSHEQSTGLLLLCEVALGEMYERIAADHITVLPTGKHSVMGCGATAPDPAERLVLPDGVIVPLGRGVPSPAKKRQDLQLRYNEYIVYDPAQVRIRFLVRVRFHFVQPRRS